MSRDKKSGDKEPLTKIILNYLGETSKDLLDLSLKIVFDPRALTRGMSLYKDASYYFPQEFSNLKKSSYFKKDGEKFYLTEKGRIKIIKNILRNKKIKNRKWNGVWLGIIFDIPEINRKERAFLRRELEWIGCKELQKSVWVTPFDIEEELLALLKLWKRDFRGDIRFLRIQKITGEDALKKRFEVK